MPLLFEELVGLLLQEEQSRKLKSLSISGGDQALAVQGKGKGKVVGGNQSRTDSGQSSGKEGDQPKKKGKCHFCKKSGHYIADSCKRLAKKKRRRKSLGCQSQM